MKIQNIRFGHATNSSSSHSIVVMPPNLKHKPKTDTSYWNQSSNYYGWEDFVLADSQSKSNYIAAQLYQSMVNHHQIPQAVASAAIDRWFDIDFNQSDDVGVDHQSALHLPKNITSEFINQLKSFIQNERVVIYGGNDNTEGTQVPRDFAGIKWLDAITDSSHNRTLKNDGKYWVIYDHKTGAKIRFSMDVNDFNAIKYTKATTPELVDVKLTNWCPFGCEFCYQSSTTQGKHAETYVLDRIFRVLSNMGVFEVALGGGEPTMYPEFDSALRRLNELNITPNFTTFSTKWLNNSNILQAVKQYVGGIGVSLHNAKDIEKMRDIAQAVNDRPNRFINSWGSDDYVTIMGQHVLGTHPIDYSIDLIKRAWQEKIPVLLLGYKNVGFGNTFKPHDTTGLAVALKMLLNDTSWHQLSVDTAVLDQYPDLCEVLKIDQALTTSPEGKFSMYWDAVENKIGPSSYCDQSDMIKLNESCNSNQVTEIFSQF